MIKVKNLTLAFGEKSLYNNAEFDIPDNQVTVISGTNGVGKTTLLKIMSGQIKVPNAVIENSFKDAENVPILLTSIVSQSGNSTPKGLFLFINSWIFIKVSPSLVW